ncbi:hypothetical protein ACFOOK_20270 [Micromonospora krabiensis]|uniref:Secreted protein n=1 Tax=Micromonospora krabiensis TaxID=307121 RepID=A0A1C3N933_9ACTN|nr:hypothetical protein [Micromonospora krabiensis]SBV29092.1 hypothetical protein GA0070620_4657 [Micromonospora krabiensis]
MRRGLFALPLLLALTLPACGGSDGEPAVATAGGGGAAASASPAAQLSDDERRLRFTECMRENGVDVPDPEPGGDRLFRFDGKTDPAKVEAAMGACRQYLPNGGEKLKLDPEQVERLRQLAACMRENGVPEFPDPQPDGGIQLRLDVVNLKDPKVKAAMEKCRQYAPKIAEATR